MFAPKAWYGSNSPGSIHMVLELVGAGTQQKPLMCAPVNYNSINREQKKSIGTALQGEVLDCVAIQWLFHHTSPPEQAESHSTQYLVKQGSTEPLYQDPQLSWSDRPSQTVISQDVYSQLVLEGLPELEMCRYEGQVLGLSAGHPQRLWSTGLMSE